MMRFCTLSGLNASDQCRYYRWSSGHRRPTGHNDHHVRHCEPSAERRMTFLLDVNVFIAFIWKQHLRHSTARKWFSRQIIATTDHFATYGVTQSGFVQVSSNPAVRRGAVSVQEAAAVLGRLVSASATLASKPNDVGGGTRIATVTDADGNTLGLITRS